MVSIGALESMSNDRPSGTYSTHLSGELAEEIEEDVERRGISKSKAVRELLVDGKRYRDERVHIFSTAVKHMMGASLGGALALLTSVVFIIAAQQVGFTIGISPLLLMISSAILILVTGLGVLFRSIGVDEYADDQVNRFINGVLDTLGVQH